MFAANLTPVAATFADFINNLSWETGLAPGVVVIILMIIAYKMCEKEDASGGRREVVYIRDNS